MSVTFKYLLTGATVTFTQQVDIDSMKGHPEYERVTEEATPAKEKTTPTVVTKKAGRPSKAEQLTQLEAM
jgi:hypothetical protein